MSWNLHSGDLWGLVLLWKRSPNTYRLGEPERGCAIVLLSPRNGKGLDASLYSAGMTAGKLIS